MANVSQREHKASINCVLLKLKEIRTDIKTLDTRLDEKNKEDADRKGYERALREIGKKRERMLRLYIAITSALTGTAFAIVRLFLR